jgi:transcriptional regulator with XRE-family HTH domain
MNKISFAEIIKSQKSALGWTDATLSRVSGVCYPTLKKIEENKSRVVTKHYWLLAKALGISFNAVLFAKIIRAKRKALGWSEKKLALVSKVGFTTVYWVERNKPPAEKFCCKIAKALNIKPDEISSCFQ